MISNKLSVCCVMFARSSSLFTDAIMYLLHVEGQRGIHTALTRQVCWYPWLQNGLDTHYLNSDSLKVRKNSSPSTANVCANVAKFVAMCVYCIQNGEIVKLTEISFAGLDVLYCAFNPENCSSPVHRYVLGSLDLTKMAATLTWRDFSISICANKARFVYCIHAHTACYITLVFITVYK